MTKWLSRSARSFGIFVLLLLQGIATGLAIIFGWPANGALSVATWARDRRRELARGTD